MISRETIDEIKNRIDIIDVVGDFVTLKRSGQNYKALSPFTNEKTASFYVVPSKGIFKDFSSGKGGDGITFVMEHEGMSYVEALRHLAKKYGVEIKEDAFQQDQLLQQTDRDALYILMNYAKDYYKQLLKESDEGKSVGLSYFHERGFNDRTIDKFELGYSVNEWDHLHKKAVSAGYSEEMLEKAGLVIRKENTQNNASRVYDRFRGRIIFPVHNLAGKVVAFGARMLTKEKDQPKYLNSPETEIYHKSNVLYGLFQSKNAIRREDFCYLVEGYTDVISLHQSDIDNVVASSGTALTEDQIKLIRRFTENITVLFDGDAAGIKAALRGIDLVLKGGLNVRVVLLPDGEDPDSMSRTMGSTAYKAYLKDHTKDFISFKTDLLAADAAQDPIKKAELIKEITHTISLIPDAIKRSVYLQECSKKLEIPLSTINVEVNKYLIRERNTKEEKRENKPPIIAPNETLSEFHSLSKSFLITPEKILAVFEREYLKVLLNRGYKQTQDQEELKAQYGFEYEFLFDEASEVDFIGPLNQEINELYRTETIKGNILEPQAFVKILPRSLSDYIADVLIQKHYVSPNWKRHHIYIADEYTEHSLYKVTLQWKLGFVQKMLADNLLKIKLAKDVSEIDSLMEIQFNIDNYKNKYASKLGRVILPSTSLLEA